MIKETLSAPVSLPLLVSCRSVTSTRKNRGTAYAGKALAFVVAQFSSSLTVSSSWGSGPSELEALREVKVMAAQPNCPSYPYRFIGIA